MEGIWTVRDALEWTTGFLERKGDANPRLSSERLMSHATGLARIEVYANYDRPLSTEERAVLRDAVQRRGAGEPLQYIIGEVGFRHIDIRVREGVLIPRPETEVLVSEVLAELPAAARPRAAEYAEVAEEGEGAEADGARPLLVADLCTGSGCIACSLAYEHPLIEVVATDISPEAVRLAAENVERLGLSERVRVLECDLGAGLGERSEGALDAVVSNPPYIPSAVMRELPHEVSAFEPELALHGGADGLDVYRRLLGWAAGALRCDGVLAVELHETCLDAAAALAREAGFASVRIADDLAGRPRVLIARR